MTFCDNGISSDLKEVRGHMHYCSGYCVTDSVTQVNLQTNGPHCRFDNLHKINLERRALDDISFKGARFHYFLTPES